MNTRYNLITADGKLLSKVSAELTEKVEDAIANGWSLCGGVSLAVAESGYGYKYTMVQATQKKVEN